MKPRVFIIHGWNGSPANMWFPWLREQLTHAGMDVYIPALPRARHPSIAAWTRHLKKVVGVCNAETYFIGHSLGAQAVLRYLAAQPEGTQAGGVVCVGGFMTLGDTFIRRGIARLGMGEWLRTSLDAASVRRRCRSIRAIFSAEDTWVTPDNRTFFAKDLGADVSVVRGYGHFTSYDHVIAVPEAVASILQMAGLPVPDFSAVERIAPQAPVSRWRMAWDVVQWPVV